MEGPQKCFVCGVSDTPHGQMKNAALLSVLATLLGSELVLAPLPTSLLCRRCCHLLTEAASLQERLHQVKTAVLSVYRPVRYHETLTAGAAGTTLPASDSSLTPSAAPAAGSPPTAGGPPVAGSVQLPVVARPQADTETLITSGTSAEAPAPTGLPSSCPSASTTTTAGASPASSARRLPCPVCGKSVTARYLPAHQRQHSGERPFTCNLCSRAFTKSSDLATHRRRHAGDRRHRCPLCPAAFFFPHELARHRHRHGDTRPHLCPVCGAGFFSRAGALRHQRADHPTEAAAGVDSSQPAAECGQCGKRFACERSLRRHVRAHGAARKYMCEECGVTYRTSTALRFHTKRQHSGERPYQCEVCGRRFITRSVWLRHLRVHTGEAPFRCQFCAANYKDKQKLKRHYLHKHAAEVERVGAENLSYDAASPAERTGPGQRAPPPPPPPPPPAVSVAVCGASGLDPGQAQPAACDPGWSQQWKPAGDPDQAFGDASAAVAELESNGVAPPQEMAPVEMMQDSAVLPQGMLYEAQSALFSYF